MADLDQLNSSMSVKIAGSDQSGSETFFVNSTANNELRAFDGINVEGVQGSLTVGTTAIEAKAEATRLANRKVLAIYNNSVQTIFWGFTSGVTTSTGIPLQKGELLVLKVSDVSVWLIAGTNNNNVRIVEAR
jgi:hypothetical protein